VSLDSDRGAPLPRQCAEEPLNWSVRVEVAFSWQAQHRHIGNATEIGVVGAREACEAVRIQADKKPKGIAGDDSMHMTESCKGPYRFRSMNTAQGPR
jgi:hypothetical protein